MPLKLHDIRQLLILITSVVTLTNVRAKLQSYHDNCTIWTHENDFQLKIVLMS